MQLRSCALVFAFLVAGCFDPSDSPDETGATDEPSGSGSGTSSGTSDGTSSASTGNTSPTSTNATSTTNATTTTDATTTMEASTNAESSGGGGGPICEQGPGALTTCVVAADGTPTYGTIPCDPAEPDFLTFSEDVYEIDLVAGNCLTVHVDNIGAGGATGDPAADIAIQIRSPSGETAWIDDVIPCTDPPWTGGGSCPSAALTADIDGTFAIAIVQAAGAGCPNPAPYALYTAVDGVDTPIAAPAMEDVFVDCH